MEDPHRKTTASERKSMTAEAFWAEGASSLDGRCFDFRRQDWSVGRRVGAGPGGGIGGRRSIKRYETFLMNVALTHQSELLPREDEKKNASIRVRSCVRVCARAFFISKILKPECSCN